MVDNDLTHVRVDRLESRVDRLDRITEDLERDVAEIRVTLASLATKLDVSELAERLSSKIDTAVNGLLRDAISAVPARQAAIWALVSGICVIVGIVVAVIR